MTARTAVVLAAGEGTRLRPLTRNRPKPMLPAANRPILEHVLDALVDAGIDRIAIVVGYHRERVQEYFGPSYRDVPLEYVLQAKQLGSGHALLQARDVVDGSLIVVNGDRIIEPDAVAQVSEAHESGPAPAAMAYIERPSARNYGAVTVQDRLIEDIVEKPESDAYRLINAGIYAFGPDVFDRIEATEREAGELGLPDTIAHILDRERVRAVKIGGMWVDATFPWDLLEVASEVLVRGRVPEPQRREGVWIDENAVVSNEAVLQPPVVVGPDCEVGAGVVLGPTTALGRNVTVGANATIERAVLDDDVRVDPGATVIDAVLGQAVALGAGVVVPGGPGDVRVGREIHEDQPLGAVMADRATAEGCVSLAPGTLVGPNATIRTGVVASGTVPEGAEVVR
ncbi:MAG: sugar phosphate nucleotidyltransferase [Haloarculaceae archaeon]